MTVGIDRARAAIVLAILAVAAALLLVAWPHEPSQAERVDRISSELRCPVCQGLSVRDSSSDTARQMRDLVAERVREGRSDEEIRDEFRRSYGDWILLSPPTNSWSVLIWLVPLVLLGAGTLLVLASARRGPAAAGVGPSPAQIAALRERVAREEAAEG